MRPGGRWAPPPWVAVGLLAAAWALWGVLAAPGERVAGEQFLDGMGTQWFYWYAEQTLFGGEGFEHSQLLFFPFGKDLYVHTGGNLVDAYLALPLRALLGHIAGYNATVALIFLLNAWGAARLAASFGAGPLGQAAAAALLCLNPYGLGELDQGRPTQALVAFLPLGLAFLRERRGLLAGVCLALCGFTYWYYGLVAGAAAALLGVIALLQDEDRWAVVRTWAVAGALCLALVLPVALPMLGSVEAGGVPGLLVFDGEGPLGGLHLRTAEGDPQGLFVQALNGDAGSITPRPEGPEFVAGAQNHGWLHGLLILPALWWLGRRSLPLVLLALLGLVLGTGPVLWLGGPENPLYIGLLKTLPFMRRWWWPMRATALLQVSLAALAGLSLHGLLQHLGPRVEARWGARALKLTELGLWGMLLPSSAAWSLGKAPLSWWNGVVSPVVSECLRDAPEGAVMDLPLAWDQFHLYDQVWHEKPQMGGMLSKKPAFGAGPVEALLSGNDLAMRVVGYGDRRFTLAPEVDEEAREALLSIGYRYVLLRHEALRLELPNGRTLDDTRRAERLISKVLGPPAASDPDGPHPVTLWTLDGSALPCE